MKNTSRVIFSFLCLFALSLTISCTQKEDPNSTIKQGWITSLAVQGQMMLAINEAPELKNDNLTIELVPFSFGAPVVEAALAGRIDVAVGGTQPMLSLASRNDNWKVVARNTVVRHSLIIPPTSNKTTLESLKGSKIGVTFASSAERMLLLAFEGAGIDINEIEMINISPAQQGEIVRSGNASSWGQFDAIVSWEPTISLLEDAGLAKEIYSDLSPVLILMSNDLISDPSGRAAQYFCSMKKAWLFYSQNREIMNTLYREKSGSDIDSRILNSIADTEANARASLIEDVSIDLTDDLVVRLSETLKFLKEQDRVENYEVSIEQLIDTSVQERAGSC